MGESASCICAVLRNILGFGDCDLRGHDLRGLQSSNGQEDCQGRKDGSPSGATYYLRLENIQSAPDPPTIPEMKSGKTLPASMQPLLEDKLPSKLPFRVFFV